MGGRLYRCCCCHCCGRCRHAHLRTTHASPRPALTTGCHGSHVLPRARRPRGSARGCSGLRRLGHFTQPIALFRDRLSHFLDNRCFLVQYAQCLYETGQHAEVVKLAEEMAPPRLIAHDTLQIYWDTLVRAAGSGPDCGHLRLGNGSGLITDTKGAGARHWPGFDSTEVCFFCHVAIAGPGKHIEPRNSCWTVPTTRPFL